MNKTSQEMIEECVCCVFNCDYLILTTKKYKDFASSLALDPTFGIHFHKTLDIAQPCHLLKPN